MPSLKTISTVSMSEIPSDGSSTNDYPIGLLPGNERGNPFLLSQKTCAILRGDVNGFRPSKPLSLPKCHPAPIPLESAATSSNPRTECNNVTCPAAGEITIRQPQVGTVQQRQFVQKRIGAAGLGG